MSRSRPVPRPMKPRLRLEQLEVRVVPTLKLTYGGAGTALTLTETSAGADTVTISQPTTTTLQIILNAPFDPTSSTTGVTYSNGNTVATITTASANAITTLTADLGDMNDSLSLSLPNTNRAIGSVAIDGQAGFDTVTISGVTLGNNTLLGTLTVFADVIQVNGAIDTSAAAGDPTFGKVDLTADQNIVVGADISTNAGDITLTANRGATPTSGTFTGIQFSNNGAAIISATGNIKLDGRGGNTGAGNIGVQVYGQIISNAFAPGRGPSC